MNHRINAARLEGKSHGLRGHAHSGSRYEDLEELKAYHEGYKEGLDECYGQGVYEGLAGAAGGAIAGGMLGGVPGAIAGGLLGSELGNEKKTESSIPATVPGMADAAMDEGNAFTAALAKTPRGGQFKVAGKTFTDRTGYDSKIDEYAFESLDRQLNELLSEGLSVSVSKGQQNAPDSVTITAQDAEADQLLQLVKHAGLGLFGDDTPAEPSQAMSIAPTSGEPDEVGAGGAEIDVVDDSDGMLALMKKLGGVEASGSDDYANEEGEETCNECGGMMEADHTCSNCHDSSENTAVVDEFLDVTVAQKGMGGDSGSSSGVAGVTSTGGTSGATGGFSNANAQSGSAADADAQARADAKSTSNESESPDQEEFEVAEDNAPDSDEAETSADEDAEAEEDKALATKSMNESFTDILARLNALSESKKEDDNEDENPEEDGPDHGKAWYDTSDELKEGEKENTEEKSEKKKGAEQSSSTGLDINKIRAKLKAGDLNEWANQVGKGEGKGTDASFEEDIEFMTKVIAGGLNKPKSTGQTTIPVIAGQEERMHDHQGAVSETVDDWVKLAGIK